ncbi:ABC transporter ATP-binding protein/permease [Methylobacillus arboreus]|uniref:ABC transporter ATP-binding protein n=1 Tax=Methylobacillus arboreus TaxID=755170 RepID=UPI001E5E8E0C|nr:ABC transporter ATP-binding protein [Methylobacillus arboreus]MCB5189980.1 ABC transporter ATP-binding protein/permease [Methylobacillus arboreus]
MSVLRKLHAILTPTERRRAAVLLLLMIVGMLLETLGVGLVVPVVGMIIQGDLLNQYPLLNQIIHFFSMGGQLDIITVAMLILVGIYLVKGLFLSFLVNYQARYSYGLQQNVSRRLFELYLKQPYAFHLQRNSAQLIRNVTTETNLFAISTSAFLLILTEVLVLVGVLLLLLVIEPVGATVVLLSLGVFGLAFLSFSRRHILRWGRERQHHEGMRIQHIQQGLGGIKDVLLLGRESNFMHLYSSHNSRVAKVAGYQFSLQQMPRLWLEFTAVVGLAILVLLMTTQGRGFQEIMPTLALFAAAAFRLLPSANRLLGSIQTVRYGLPIVDMLYQELSLVMLQPSVENKISFNSAMELQSVEFTYPSSVSPTLRNVSFKITKGQSIGLIGESGSGKSTIIDIILGLLKPQAGHVMVDGQDIHQALRSWQDMIGYVPQSIFLTDDSLKHNIAFGIAEDNIDMESLQKAIHAAQLHTFVDSLPHGIDTVVGERGVRLSGGQRQRIGIARALYHDPDILVLDEATSALDEETEKEVMQAVDMLHGSKTIVIVAHRLSTVRNCDRILRFQAGELIQSGTVQEILHDKILN